MLPMIQRRIVYSNYVLIEITICFHLCTIISMKVRAKRMPGRPPSSVGEGGKPEKSSDYPKLVISIRPNTKAVLDAIMALEKRSGWKVVETAILDYRDRLPAEDRRAVDLIAKRMPASRSSKA
jgi:hypothetical protein